MSYTPIPMFIPYSSDSAGDRQVDFFCKTEENKTEAQEQYCNDYLKSESAGDVFASILFIFLIAFMGYIIWDIHK